MSVLHRHLAEPARQWWRCVANVDSRAQRASVFCRNSCTYPRKLGAVALCRTSRTSICIVLNALLYERRL